ncbi:hypothetical protein AOL_s00110g207 [Orbilia oligospora ATCC 24927]|uniref:BTB domain-containing protein n=1 Tax=Arthrobotrys oligospora (strain ATCC 24927 / CBS 115.81 / DSM 1491) TaxID=756982 RepID=G1XL37_ARTOA|nr:hypothetical protein AOL_s00110g207 [Orbilia oligospora ATCC 24927]EGX46043.1 hypothetical protein AOL_s00110g207 [Orbilia oligospora ATCC 24927]
MADVILTIGAVEQRQKYYGHELILSTASEYLGQLCRNCKERAIDGRKVIYLPQLNPEAMEIILRWIYGDRRPFSGVDCPLLVSHIVFAASNLGLEALGRPALDYLGDLVDKTTDNEKSGVAVTGNERTTNASAFTEPLDYWKLIRDICNWAYGWDTDELLSVMGDLTTTSPSPPKWLADMSTELNPTLLAMLLLGREQRLRNLSSCDDCQPLPMKGLDLSDDRYSECVGCEVIEPELCERKLLNWIRLLLNATIREFQLLI